MGCDNIGICIQAYRARIGKFKPKVILKDLSNSELNKYKCTAKKSSCNLFRILIWSVLLVSVYSYLDWTVQTGGEQHTNYIRRENKLGLQIGQSYQYYSISP